MATLKDEIAAKRAALRPVADDKENAPVRRAEPAPKTGLEAALRKGLSDRFMASSARAGAMDISIAADGDTSWLPN